MSAKAPYKVTVVGVTDIGLVRQNNEDIWAELPEERIFILADGMGGHQAGEVASREAVSSLCHLLQRAFKGKKKSPDEACQAIKQAILTVNQHVYKLGRSTEELKGMGTTLCVLHLHEEHVIFAHVGDSRIYRLRNGVLNLLTRDHSLLRELVDLGQIGEDQVEEFHYKNIITRAIGTEPYVEPTLNAEELHHSDLFVLCSDGLSDLLSMREMENLLKSSSTISEAATELVSLSKKKGARDNITIIIVKVTA